MILRSVAGRVWPRGRRPIESAEPLARDDYRTSLHEGTSEPPQAGGMLWLMTLGSISGVWAGRAAAASAKRVRRRSATRAIRTAPKGSRREP